MPQFAVCGFTFDDLPGIRENPGGKITLGRAAKIASLMQLDFQQELGRRGIPIHYDVEDLRSDLQTLAALRDK